MKERSTEVKLCPRCKGTKEVVGVAMFGEKVSFGCPRCWGTGKVPA